MVQKRSDMLFTPTAMMANIFHPRWRGKLLCKGWQVPSLLCFALPISDHGFFPHMKGYLPNFDPTSAQRATTLRGLSNFCVELEPRSVPKSPVLDEVMEYISERGVFGDTGNLDCHPFHFWSVLHPESFEVFMRRPHINISPHNCPRCSPFGLHPCCSGVR